MTDAITITPQQEDKKTKKFSVKIGQEKSLWVGEYRERVTLCMKQGWKKGEKKERILLQPQP